MDPLSFLNFRTAEKGVEVNDLEGVLKKWDTVDCGSFFDGSPPPREMMEQGLPAAYLDIVEKYGGKEGFLGTQYLRLFAYDDLISINEAYEIPHYLPILFLIGTNGAGEGYALLVGEERVVQVPLIPLAQDYVELVGSNLVDFLGRMAATGSSIAPRAELIGQQIHLIQPICLGGSPTDLDNRIVVSQVKHAELARYWNKLYFELVQRSS